MTYSIIPPILVILSVIGIILFLMKKAPRVAKLKERTDVIKKEYAGGSSDPAETGARQGRVKHFFLLLLEKITKKFKVRLLRLENIFSVWNESLRKRRNKHASMTGSGSFGELAKKENFEKTSDENWRQRETRGEKTMNSEVRKGADTKNDRSVRPMISEKIIVPKNRAELKNRLEKLLIERIAVNPKDIEAYERLGEYYFEVGNLEYSKECFKQVIKLDSNSPNARSKMRRLENLLGK